MGSELLRIAEGFSIVAEGLRGLAKAEGGSKTAEKTQKAQLSATEKAQPEAQPEKPATLEGIRALMLRVEEKGYPIVMHCHDEIIAEVPEGTGSVEEMCEIMAVQPAWAAGLPLRADGYSCSFYQKQ